MSRLPADLAAAHALILALRETGVATEARTAEESEAKYQARLAGFVYLDFFAAGASASRPA